MTLVRRLLLDRRRGSVGWAIGMAAMVGLMAAFYPSVRDSATFAQAIEDLPDALKALSGLSGDISFTSPVGYLHARLFTTLAPILLLVLGIGIGARITAGVEEDGTLERLLSGPVSRRRVTIERHAAMVMLIALQGVVLFVSVIAIAPAVGLLDGVRAGNVAWASVSAVCLALVHASIAHTVGALTGRRSAAISAATAVAVVGYLLHGLGTLSPAANTVAAFFPWHWYLDQNVVADGPTLVGVVLPLAVTSLLLAAGVSGFERRDLR